jgi:hypothetical protein
MAASQICSSPFVSKAAAPTSRAYYLILQAHSSRGHLGSQKAELQARLNEALANLHAARQPTNIEVASAAGEPMTPKICTLQMHYAEEPQVGFGVSYQLEAYLA